MTATVPGMADKGWTARVATAAGVAAGTGAAQLGLGYGLGVIVWPVTVAEDRSEWLGSLGWATWITASATVFGAVIASRLGGVRPARPRRPWRSAFAISAGVGALVAVALIALPARAAVRLDAHTPQMIAASYALLGVALGVIVAFWAVRSRPVAANLIATSAWLWALAITAIVVELVLGRDTATYLTSWQFVETSTTRYGVIYWPSALLSLAAAFVIGVIAVVPAVRRGDLGLGAAISGAVGPLLVAVSFLALSPRLTGTPGPIESAYLIAPYAVLSGLAGSALVFWGDRGALGASGAIFGLMGALLIVAIKVRGDVRGILTWIGINFVLTFAIAHISWQGHLGGFLAGAAIGAIMVYAPRGPRRTTVQVLGTSAVALSVVVAIVLRIAQLS